MTQDSKPTRRNQPGKATRPSNPSKISKPRPASKPAGNAGRTGSATPPKAAARRPAAPPVLTNAQKKHLRTLGHDLPPLILIGREGMTPTLLDSADAALKAHELVKARLGQNAPLERQEAADELIRRTGAALVQQIGKVFLLYRPNPDLPADRRVAL